MITHATLDELCALLTFVRSSAPDLPENQVPYNPSSPTPGSNRPRGIAQPSHESSTSRQVDVLVSALNNQQATAQKREEALAKRRRLDMEAQPGYKDMSSSIKKYKYNGPDPRDGGYGPKDKEDEVSKSVDSSPTPKKGKPNSGADSRPSTMQVAKTGLRESQVAPVPLKSVASSREAARSDSDVGAAARRMAMEEEALWDSVDGGMDDNFDQVTARLAVGSP